MAMYTSEMRVKEIGIRKVLGASTSGLSMMLGKDFIKLIIIAAVLAIPLSWASSDYILQAFAYRTSLSFWVFPSVIFFILSLGLMTIGSQTIKAATANPSDTLKEE